MGRSMTGIRRVKLYLLLVFIIWSSGVVYMMASGWDDNQQRVMRKQGHGEGGQAVSIEFVSPERAQKEKEMNIKRDELLGELSTRTGEWATKIRAKFDPSAIEPVDVLFLWVNGTDPEHIAKFEKVTGRKMDAKAMRRFRDYGTLRFGVRSVEKFVPFMRNLHIVTSGQVPSWWNENNPRGHIVPHDTIFVYNETDLDGTVLTKPIEDALPTFNSNAIEANIHNVPGLAKYVLYLNDDFLVGAPLTMDDFIDTQTGMLKLNMGGFVAPNEQGMRTNIWHRSVGHANTLINQVYHPEKPKTKHYYAGHVCYFLDKDVLDHIYSLWPDEFISTSKRKFRYGGDTSLPFMMVNVALEEKLGTKGSPITSGYAVWSHKHDQNEAAWRKISRSGAKCLCIQDGFEASPNIDSEVAFLEEKLCEMFPDKSSFESPDEPNPCDKYKKKR